MTGFQPDVASDDEIDREEAAFGPLAQAVRELADATIRSTVDPAIANDVREQVEALTARLRASQIDGSYGVPYRADGNSRPWGNAVMGLRNPIAPPLDVVTDPSGRADAHFQLGAAYEGPPGLVHGGVVSLLLDQMLGQAGGAGGHPGMTGTLTVIYRQGTPLFEELHAEAWIDRVDGIKTWVKGRINGPDGVTAEAEGIFILPRWAREILAKREAGGPDIPKQSYFA